MDDSPSRQEQQMINRTDNLAGEYGLDVFFNDGAWAQYDAADVEVDGIECRREPHAWRCAYHVMFFDMADDDRLAEDDGLLYQECGRIRFRAHVAHRAALGCTDDQMFNPEPASETPESAWGLSR